MVKEEVINRSVSGGSVKWFAHCMTSELFESEMLRDCNNGSNIRFERWIADPVGSLPERSAFKPFEQGEKRRCCSEYVAETVLCRSRVGPIGRFEFQT